jgi:dimethylamine/trimethylamine dehydrogenase
MGQMDPRHAILFEPVTVGPKTLPNRFYQVPHASGFGSLKPRTHAAFRAVKAEGGWGGVCTDYAPVSPDSDETSAVASDCWDAADMERLGLIADAVHEHGALAGIELVHGGALSPNGESRYPRLAPTQAAADPQYAGMAKEMTHADIRRVQQDFVTAARRAREAGFDIVYIYGAHGYLMTQMLSVVNNRRTDAYGGSLRNRARFQLETLAMTREAVGDDCAIAIRMPAAGGHDLLGLEQDDLLEFFAMADPLVDLFDVNVGAWPEDSGTSRYFGEGSQLPWTSKVRAVTSKPMVGVGRFTNPDTMAAVIRSGDLDLIGAARPAIADPYLPTKIREGRVDEIRECTGSNVCILREESFKHVGCLQNATAGEEYRRGWHPERFSPARSPERSVLVVGAGLAGLECAMVLGRRGFDAVHVVDAEPEVGGKMRWIRQLPTLGDWGRTVDHRVVGLSKLPNVEVILGRRLTAADVLDYGADLVVVATGSRWCDGGTQPHQLGPLTGAERSLTPERIMAGQRPPQGRVVVYDTDGYFAAPGMAEMLALEGYEVHLVTPLDKVSPVSDDALEGDMLRQHLHDLGITFHTNVALQRIEQDEVLGRTSWGDAWSMSAQGVVLVTQQRSEDSLYRELLADPDALTRAGIQGVYAIGDAVAPRMPSEAVFDGHRLGRDIEEQDPMAPSPWLRERPVAERGRTGSRRAHLTGGQR